MFKQPFRRYLSLALVLALVLTASFGSSGQAAAAGETDLGRAIAAQEAHTDALMAIDGVIGTAVGRGSGGGHIVLALTIAGGIPGIPGAVDGVIVRPYVTGEILAQPKPGSGGVDRTARFDRPVPIGISTGHPDITAGTIGARVTDGTNVYALTNNHIYADENQASMLDAVIQPGTIDGGSGPADEIGNLHAYVPIVFSTSANNVVDAAIASTTISLLGNSTPAGEGYGTPSSTPVDATIGLNVRKYGRTTGQTDGKVDAVNATVNIGYDSGTARFVGQIIIKGRKGSFSAGGDSGSLIVSKDGSNPVALLYAGSNTVTIGSPISAVLSAFGVTIDGTGTAPAPADTGSISGKVSENGGPAIAGATVSTGTGQSATTDANGDYLITNVPVGTAAVTASKAGFATSSPQSETVTKDLVTSGVNFSLVALELGISTVASITFEERYRGPNTDLIFTIDIDDQDGNPVAGATITGVLFREGRSWNIGGVTDSSGSYSGKLRSARVGTEYTVRVDGVSHDGFIYDDPDPAAQDSHTVVGP